MKFGAGTVAAQRSGAAEIVDPRPFVDGTIAAVFERYDVGAVLPAEGYSPAQLKELEERSEDAVRHGGDRHADGSASRDPDRAADRTGDLPVGGVGTPTLRDLLAPVLVATNHSFAM